MAVFDLFRRFVNQNPEPVERRADDRLRASLGARVLVVDDSATIRAVLGKMLMQDGYQVLKAAEGESAVEMAQSQLPDLIFLDIVLPGISGFAVLRSLRRGSRTRNIPIVMMSGNQQATEQFYVQRFGADGFVKKPFGRAEVFHAIRSLVQAGRLAARLDVAPENVIPEGMTPEEWNAIPDVALPDDAPFQAMQAATSVLVSDDMANAKAAESASPAAAGSDDSSGQAPQPHGATHPATRTAAAPIVASYWSMPAVSMAMRPTLSSTLRAALASATSVVLHVRFPPREQSSADTATPEHAAHASDEDKA